MAEVIGVLGGMGPAATADFYTKLTRLTAASRDQDHPRVLIWSDPTIPDRTEALLGLGPDPTPNLTSGARRLAAAGATLLAVPCNTAHAFAQAAAEAAGLPLVHMIEEVARHLCSAHPEVRQVGLLATTGTIHAGLYQDWLNRYGITSLIPSTPLQAEVLMPAISDVKAGANRTETNPAFLQVATALTSQGAEVLIAGCTEVPLGFDPATSPVDIIDPTAVLAAAVLERIGTPLCECRAAPKRDRPPAQPS